MGVRGQEDDAAESKIVKKKVGQRGERSGNVIYRKRELR